MAAARFNNIATGLLRLRYFGRVAVCTGLRLAANAPALVFNGVSCAVSV